MSGHSKWHNIKGKKQAEDADNAVHPESSRFADGIYQRQKCKNDNEVERHVGNGADAHGKAADFQRQNLGNDNPADGAERKGERGDIYNHAANSHPFEIVAKRVGKPERSPQREQADRTPRNPPPRQAPVVSTHRARER